MGCLKTQFSHEVSFSLIQTSKVGVNLFVTIVLHIYFVKNEPDYRKRTQEIKFFHVIPPLDTLLQNKILKKETVIFSFDKK